MSNEHGPETTDRRELKMPLRKWLAIKRYQWAVIRHGCRGFVEVMKISVSPRLSREIGGARAERDENLWLMTEIWFARGPRPDDYRPKLRGRYREM